MKNHCLIISGLLMVLAFMPYIHAILRDRHMPTGSPGKTEPSKASWIIWVSLDTITLIGMMLSHSLNGHIVGAVSGGWFVTILAIRYGTPGWTKLDKFCILGAVVGVTMMFVKPEYGIITSLNSVFLGSIPTFVNAWKDPSKEDKLAWTIFWLSCVFAILAIPQMTVADAAQPITFMIIESIMMILLYFPRKVHNSRQQC